MAPGHRRRRARPNLPAILLVGVVLLFSAYHFTAASSHVSIDGATGRHRTAVSVASAASAEGHDAGGSGGVTSALIPLEGARTLQFDVCNGFTNQRIALMSGLVLAAELNRSLVLPDLILDGYMPDAREYVTPDKADTSPFGDWYDAEAFAAALASKGMSVVTGRAPAPTPVGVMKYDSQSGPQALVTFLRKRTRQHIKIACPAFRLPSDLVSRHGALLAAAAAALRPSPRFAALLAARRIRIGAAGGTGKQHGGRRAVPYNLLHLRVEKDWQGLCQWWFSPPEGRDNCRNNTETVGEQLVAHGFEKEVPLVVVTSFPDAVPELLAAAMGSIQQAGYTAVVKSSELAGPAEEGLPREQRALLDYYLALNAAKFIGNSVSTFTAYAALERHWLRRFSAHYNGGGIPLESFFPFYEGDG